MITTPIFTRLLSTDEYGRYNVFNSWLSIVTIFVSMSLAGGVYSQGLVKYEKDRAKFSSALQGLSTTLFIIWLIIYFIFRPFWNSVFSLTTVQVLAMLVMVWTTAVFNFWANEQRVSYSYRLLVIITAFVSLAKPIIGIIFVILAEDKVTARILGLVLVELIGYSGLYFAQMHRGKCFFDKYYWKYALKFNIPLIPHYLSQTVLNCADRIMIGAMIGDKAVGIYSLAYSLSMIMLLFNTSLMQTLSPWIYQKIKENRIDDIKYVAYPALIGIAILNLILILLAPEAVAIFAPKAYYDAVWVIPPVTMSVYFMFCYDLFAKFAFYYENTILIMLTSIIGALLNVVLNYIFIIRFGYIAAGYTTLLCYMIYSFAHYMLMNSICKKNCNVNSPYDVGFLLKLTIFFLIFGHGIMITYKYWILRLLLIVVVFISMLAFRKKIIEYAKRSYSALRNK